MDRRTSSRRAASGKATKARRGQLYHPYQVAKVLKGPASCSSCLIRQNKPAGEKIKNLGEDWIIRLPADILVLILSLFTLKEAGRTSVLSRNWRYSWTFVTWLNFDAWAITRRKQFPALARETELYHARLDRDKYAIRVNKVLESHRGKSVEEIKISFGVDGSHSRAINNWVDFAFEKGVQRFELNLSSPLMTGSYYDFARLEKFLGCDTEQEQQSNGHVKSTVRSAGFRSLVTLRLGFVNVAGDVIEHFLGNCPFLELLQVTRSSSIRNLRVADPSLKLKWLEISQCTLLKRLEILATNLVVIDIQRAIGIGIQIRDFHKGDS